ncbi:winged helix-turn-helix domain-containing protein [Streptomyces sp. NPDC056144]|uniref:winged helix-turn-helix domain-containing protein n=1 Tax=unclassified Streptomyces TaxID=2593676 RepID=UPI0035D61C4A
MAERPSPRGTYLSIADGLRKDVEGGRVTSSLPSEATLMASHGVSRNTVRRALKVLEAGRVIESVPGVGWRVVGSGDATSLVDRMVSVILDDHLAVGDVYPSESQLCTRFGASRTAVRRALAQMEGNGLLDTVHGKGRTVRALPGSTEQP